MTVAALVAISMVTSARAFRQSSCSMFCHHGRSCKIWTYPQVAYEPPGLVSELGNSLPQLTRLDFSQDTAFVHELCRCCWTGLKQLNLDENNCGMSGMQGLVHNLWPLLETVDLAFNMLGADEILLLCQARWPLLRDLRLSLNNLDAQALRHLQAGPWPLLQSLTISSCLNSTAASSERKAIVEALTTCKMPYLTHLDIAGNNFTDVNLVTTLILGDWPCLRHLDLSGNCFRRVPIALFGIDHCMVLRQIEYKFRHRFAGQFAAGRWPVLFHIDLTEW